MVAAIKKVEQGYQKSGSWCGCGARGPGKASLKRQHVNRDQNDKKKAPTGKSEGQKVSIKEKGKYNPMFCMSRMRK